MKVIQINCTYNQGSTGKIVADIHRHLKQSGVESKVVFGFGDPDPDPDIVRAAPEWIRKLQSLRARLTGFAYGGCLIGTHNIIRYLKAEKPDVVHIHCVNAYMVSIYGLLDYLKKNRIPTVLTLHAEFLYTSGCSYAIDCTKWLTGCHHCDKIGKERPNSWLFDHSSQEWKRFQRAYNGFPELTVCAVSDWVRDRAVQSPFFRGHPVITVLNGVNTGLFHYRENAELRRKFAGENQKLVIHVTPDFSNPLKGGAHVLEMAGRMPNVRFLIAGCDGRGTDAPDNTVFLAHTSNQTELAQLYSIADVCLLTSVRETFSMVCAESLCCGTPVVGFCAGAPETISIPQYSSFVKQGDDEKLEAALMQRLAVPSDKAEISRAARIKYDTESMTSGYLNIYTSAYKN